MTSIAIPMPDDAHSQAQPETQTPRRDSSLQHLTLRAARGDEGAFAALHQRLGGGLFRLFLERTGGRSELADDFSQKTWVAVWQALTAGKYDPGRAAISTFVYAVGYRVWLQHMRTTGRANAHLEAAAAGMGSVAASADPSNESKLAEMIESVRGCLRAGDHECGLTDEERWILRAASTGVTDRELAARLGVAASTANTRKQAAYDKMRRYLEKQGHRADSGGQESAGGQ
jgi:RNA polymerase sigma-70 factor (ECF subfamily)